MQSLKMSTRFDGAFRYESRWVMTIHEQVRSARAQVPEYVTKAPGQKQIRIFQDAIPQASRQHQARLAAMKEGFVFGREKLACSCHWCISKVASPGTNLHQQLC